jgi:Rhodopirellula transposase DDE domain
VALATPARISTPSHRHKIVPSKAELDRGSYPTGIKVTDGQLATVNITPDDFHGEWSYSIQPEK